MRTTMRELSGLLFEAAETLNDFENPEVQDLVSRIDDILNHIKTEDCVVYYP